jgi:hypothetical protein
VQVPNPKADPAALRGGAGSGMGETMGYMESGSEMMPGGPGMMMPGRTGQMVNEEGEEGEEVEEPFIDLLKFDFQVEFCWQPETPESEETEQAAGAAEPAPTQAPPAEQESEA